MTERPKQSDWQYGEEMPDAEIERRFPNYVLHDGAERPVEPDETETPDEETYWTWWLTFHA